MITWISDDFEDTKQDALARAFLVLLALWTPETSDEARSSGRPGSVPLSGNSIPFVVGNIRLKA